MFILENIDIFLFSKIVKKNIGKKHYLHKYILRHILINLFIY